MGSVYSHDCVLSICSRAAICLNENVIFLTYLLPVLYYCLLSKYMLSIDDRGKLLSMNDTAFIVLALETSLTFLGDKRTIERVLWQQMCPDRYKQSWLCLPSKSHMPV